MLNRNGTETFALQFRFFLFVYILLHSKSCKHALQTPFHMGTNGRY